MPRFKYDAMDLERFFVSDFARGEYETKSRIAKEIYRRYIQGSRRGGTRDIRVELRSKERRRKDIRADLWGLIERYEMDDRCFEKWHAASDVLFPDDHLPSVSDA